MPTIVDLPNGLHLGIPSDIYHARVEGLASKSALDLIERSPAHYLAWLGGLVRPDTEALKFGKALHCSMLEPATFGAEYAVQPDFGDCRFKEAKARRDGWRSEHKGQQWLEPVDAKAIEGMTEALHAHPLASKMLQGGVAEATLRWVDEDTGLICKARSDYYIEALDAVFDIKTTEDARASSFRMSVARYRYHVQQAHYARGFAAIGRPLKHFVFVAMERAAPYAIGIYNLDIEAMAKGLAATRRNLTTFAECVESGSYPAYDGSIQTLDLPAWAA